MATDPLEPNPFSPPPEPEDDPELRAPPPPGGYQHREPDIVRAYRDRRRSGPLRRGWQLGVMVAFLLLVGYAVLHPSQALQDFFGGRPATPHQRLPAVAPDSTMDDDDAMGSDTDIEEDAGDSPTDGTPVPPVLRL